MASRVHQVMRTDVMRCEIRGLGTLLAAFASLASMHCTSASTAVLAPSANKCQLALTTRQSSFGPNGGQTSIVVATERDCQWTITAEASWISITGTRSGQGEAEVGFTVAANPVPSARTGGISAGSERVELSQAPAPCTYQLSRTADVIGPNGGRVSVGVTTLTGCGWGATSDASWIAIESGASASASGSVGLSAAANSGAARVGQVTIAGQRYTLSQDAAPSATPPSPPGTTPAPPTPPGPAPPPPTPTPPPSQPVEFDGRVSSLAGSCPNLSFSAGGRKVLTSSKTTFKGGKCKDLSNGDKVGVKGTLTNGVVDASHIDLD